ncbi:MAG TPA: hypothetical protein VKQ27_00430, partial [Acetobacteraceae bacterium]|nr:hypothetical protein [Acetobacteraceae bacterium]
IRQHKALGQPEAGLVEAPLQARLASGCRRGMACALTGSVTDRHSDKINNFAVAGATCEGVDEN